MVRFAPLLPEIVLAIGGLFLMMLAAFTGRRGTALVSWLAVALLVAATVALIGPPSHAGPLFDGMVSADLFASFGKAVIFPAAAIAIIAAHGWFDRDSEHASEYSVLIVFAAVGMAVMVSATSLVSLYVGLELNSLAGYVLASYLRKDERSAEAGLKYFVLGALASGILLYGISLLYGFTGTMSFTGIAAAFGRGAPTLGLLFGLVFVLAGLAFKASAVPFHMWTPDVYEGAPTPVTTFFASAPKVASVLLATRVCVDALGPATEAWRQIVIFAALASIFVGAIAAYGQTNIKRLLAYSSINNVGFALVGLAAGGAQGASAVLFYMVVYVVMTIGAFLCVLWMRDANGEPVETIASLSGLAADPSGARRRLRNLHVQPCRRTAAVRFLAQAAGVHRRLESGLCRARRCRLHRRGNRRLLLPQDRQGDVHGRAGRALWARPCAGPGSADPDRGAARLPARLSVDRPAWRTDGQSCRKPVLTRIHIVERTGSTNADLIADNGAIEGDWLIALEQHAGRGRQGRTWVSAPGNFYGSTLVQIGPGDPPAQTLSLAAGLALVEAIDVALPGQPLMLKWPNDVMLLGNKLAGILLERSGDRVAVGFGVNLASAPRLEDRQGASLSSQPRAASIRAPARRKLCASAGPVASKRTGDCWPRRGLLAHIRSAHPSPSIRVPTRPPPDASTGSKPDGALRLCA